MASVTSSRMTLRSNDDFEQELARKKRVKEFTKKSFKYVMVQIGIVGAVTGYVFLGAALFGYMERPNEMSECVQCAAKYAAQLNATVTKLWTVVSTLNAAGDQQVAQKAIRMLLQTFRDNNIALGYKADNCSAKDDPNGTGYNWSLMGALLFVTTVITTVGYGNIAPRTTWGRIVCIVYALLGIPLMLICLSNIGELMADVFRYVYYNVCCCGCNCFRRRVAKPRPKSARGPRLDASEQSETEAWKNHYNHEQNAAAERDIMADIEDDDEEDEENDGETEEMKITVPLTVTLGMLGFYIFVGALLFGVWNQLSWLDAAYFCFVTITTIGFGDIVPGSTSNATDAVSSLKRMVTAVYMVFGMAIISMAFNLIQEEVIGKFSWIGEKMGLIKPEDDDDDFVEDLSPLPPVTTNPNPAVGPNTIFYVPHAKAQ